MFSLFRLQETALPVQLPHTPFAPAAGAALGYTGASGSPSRPGYGRAVELASAVMCPMKQGSSVLEELPWSPAGPSVSWTGSLVRDGEGPLVHWSCWGRGVFGAFGVCSFGCTWCTK